MLSFTRIKPFCQNKLAVIWMLCLCSWSHLSCGLHPLPYAEVAHDPGNEQTQGQVPVQRAHLVNTRGNPECSSPVETDRGDSSVTPPEMCRKEDDRHPENSLPELHDRRGGIWVDCFTDWVVSPLKLYTVFCKLEKKKIVYILSSCNRKWHIVIYRLLVHICYLCSMCCCRMTKPDPKKRSSRGRKSPRPGRWCSRSSAESL